MNLANVPVPSKKRQNRKFEKPKWRSWKNPEVKHELILHGELAAVAAGIVALYLLALMPFANIQRAQLLTARLKPEGLEMAEVDKFIKLANDFDFQQDSEINKFQYRLTKRPCGKKSDLEKQTHKKCSDSTTDVQIYETKNMITERFLSYQDVFQVFTIQYCHSKKTANLCPCGIPYRHGNWCFELLNLYQQCNNQPITQENYKNYGFENLEQIFQFDQRLSLCSKSTPNCGELHWCHTKLNNKIFM